MKTSIVNWNAVLVSVLLCFGLQLMLMLLGAGIGLSMEIDTGIAIGAGIFSALTLAMSFFISGYLASRLSSVPDRLHAAVQGSATWALVILFFVVLGTQSSSSVSSLLTKAGILASKDGLAIAIEEMKKINPRIVTDVKLLKGKAITYVEANPNPPSPLQLAEGRKLLEEAKRATSYASLAAFVALLISGAAATFGGWVGFRLGGSTHHILDSGASNFGRGRVTA
jgi:hypothetical protein